MNAAGPPCLRQEGAGRCSPSAGVTGRRRGFHLSLVRKLLWTGLLAAGGYLLTERYRAIGAWIGTIGNLVLVAALAAYVYRVVPFDPSKTSSP